MTYHPFAVANYFINKAREEGVSLSPMKLQKLMYFAEGWNLAFADEELLSHPIEAWQYGPVISSVYQEFKRYGNGDIAGPATAYDMLDQRLQLIVPSVPPTDNYARQLLDQVWTIYKPYTAVQLSAMTHEIGTPWHDVYVREGMSATRGLVIGKSRMRDYFAGVLRRNAESQKAAG